jgi:cephalosporin hydroxylase
MQLISAVRTRFRAWINQGRFKPLTKPVHGAWVMCGHCRGLALRGSATRGIRAIPHADSDERRISEIASLIAGEHFHGLVYSMQVPSEISGFLRLVSELRPRRILEIGTARGGTLFALTRVADPVAHIVSLDLPGGRWGGGYPWWKSRLYRSMALPGQRIELIRADSHAPGSLARVREAFKGEPLDLLFIDGDHTYTGVRQDYEQYGPLVRAGGRIAFHDIADHPSGAGGDVPRFWREVRERHQVQEFVENPQGGYGIGVLVQGEARSYVGPS